ncbi:hypothetical protein PFISCL1PPCAC_20236, partial [Pristionchus fissidentatus]
AAAAAAASFGKKIPESRSFMQQLTPDKKKDTTEKVDQTERTERSLLSPATQSPIQTSVRKELKDVKETKIEKSASRSKNRKEKEKEERKEVAGDKSLARKVRSRLSMSRNKSKSRTDKTEKSGARDDSPSESVPSTPSPQPSPEKSSSKSSSKDSSKRLEVVSSAVDKSVKSLKKFFKKPDDTKRSVEELLPKVERDSKDTHECRRLMEMFKRNNVFENALFPYQNETLRVHFQSGSRRIDKHTMDLLFKATDFVLDKILYRGEELDEFIDNPLKAFILNRNKSRTMVVEYLLKHPEFLPQSWGGRTVVLMRSEDEVSVAPEDEKSKTEARSPHSKDK